MNRNLKSILAVTILLCFTAGAAFAGSSDKVKVKGLIISRTADALVITTAAGKSTVTLDDQTKVVQPKGLVGLRKNNMTAAALLPGLRIQVEGTGTETDVLAKKISFSEKDLETAQQIQAATMITQQNVAANQQNIEANKQGIATNQGNIDANKQGISANQQEIASNDKAVSERFSNLTDWDKNAEAIVFFPVGSAKISDSDQAALSKLASDAAGLKGYIIQVKGFADSTGGASLNQTLSMDRAQAVVSYLLQSCSVPIRHIVSPGGMGTTNPVSSNETADGRSTNRRVEVTVLVNRGVGGGQ